MLAQRLTVQTANDYAPHITLREGRYHLRFAQTEADLESVQKLRFDVFNVELGEGLSSSLITGRDQDEFDRSCHHLLVTDTESDQVIGTYRLQTGEMAAAGNGFYSAREFNLSHLPEEVLRDSVELGRACIAREHRHTQALLLLWKGIAAYVQFRRKRYLFGCCSLTSQNAAEGRAVMQLLIAGAHIHPFHYVSPEPEFACVQTTAESQELKEISLPKLFRTYLRIGAKVCGPPAIDREFGTIDFFVLMDIHELDAFSQRLLFGRNR